MMVMFCEVRKDRKWQKVGRVFDSWLKELELTDRVCDQPNSILYTVFGATALDKNDTRVFCAMPPALDGSIDMSDEVSQSRYFKDNKEVCALTLKQILNYNWDQDIKEVGYITEWQYKWQKRGNKSVAIRPHPRVNSNIVTPEEMEMILNNKNLRNDKAYSVKLEYTDHKVIDVCEFFVKHSIPKLIELVPDSGSYEDVRVIYTFAS